MHVTPGDRAALTALAIGLQSAVIVRAGVGGRLPGGVAAVAAGLAAGAACLEWPFEGASLLGAAVGLAVNGALLAAFGRSLMPGRVPVATAFAQRVHGALTPRRQAYARGVTWLWTAFFAAALCACTVRALVPGASGGKLIGSVLELPLAACLFGVEMLVRLWWFRGQQRGSLGDMVRAYRAGPGDRPVEPTAP